MAQAFTIVGLANITVRGSLEIVLERIDTSGVQFTRRLKMLFDIATRGELGCVTIETFP